MDVVIAGSHGLIGTALAARLKSRGHRVRRLVRRVASGPDEISWDPARGVIDPGSLAGSDAVVNLAGAGLGDRRWTRAYKEQILSSRVWSTTLLSRALAEASDGPKVLVQASAIGYYGDVGEEFIDESRGQGDGFLAAVVGAWERSTAPAEEAGIRVSHARTGIVLSTSGGALGRLLPLIRRGVGGRIGSGAQFWSWITLHDETRALEHLITATVSGPANLTAPNPVTNAAITHALAQAHGRRAVLPVPAWALRLAIGEFSSDVLSSSRILPNELLASGFAFDHPDLPAAVAWLRADGITAAR